MRRRTGSGMRILVTLALAVSALSGCVSDLDLDGNPQGASRLVVRSGEIEASLSGAGVGKPYSLVGLVAVCVTGRPVTIVAAAAVSGDLRVSDWAAQPDGRFSGTANQREALRNIGFGEGRTVTTPCSDAGTSTPPAVSADGVALEFTVPKGPGARLDGLRLTYDDGTNTSNVDVPLTVVMCSDGDITDECVLNVDQSG